MRVAAGPLRVWLITGLLLLYFYLAVGSLVGDSPTMDEQNHIARGLAFLRTGDPRLSLEHPPLVNALSAIPLLTLPGLRLPTDHPSWERREGWYEFADLFMWQYNHDVARIVFLARIPIVFLAMALALTAFRFGREMWGALSGPAALVLVLFEPNILAHGRYATTDLGGTLFTFLATYLLWRLWQVVDHWDWRRWVAATLAVGLAFGSKFSALGFVPIWLLLALLPLYSSSPRSGPVGRLRATGRRLVQLLTAGLGALLIVWAIYGFEWGNFKFFSEALQPFNVSRGPMPTFWAGIEQIALVSSGGRPQAFLLGRFSDTGFSLYFPIAFLLKTPAVIILLLFISAYLLLKTPATRRPAIFLLLAAAGFYAVTMQSALNIGYRHALPALPYLLVLISGLAAPALRAESTKRRTTPRDVAVPALGVGLAVLLISAIVVYPHYLSYFNPLVGGPANGYRLLTDSNVDWGQDLLRLNSWMADNNVDSVKLGWFGSADPDYYGIAHEPLPGVGRDRYFRLWWSPPFNTESPEPGVYAVSASSLSETPLRVEEKTVYSWFRAREPDARVGYSILIYVVP